MPGRWASRYRDPGNFLRTSMEIYVYSDSLHFHGLEHEAGAQLDLVMYKQST